MDALHIEKVNQSFTAFRQAAGLDDQDQLLSLMNALADSGQAGEGGAYEDLFLLLADRLQVHDRRASPTVNAIFDTRPLTLHRSASANACWLDRQTRPMPRCSPS